jgi:hypothetical protein
MRAGLFFLVLTIWRAVKLFLIRSVPLICPAVLLETPHLLDAATLIWLVGVQELVSHSA